MIELIKGRNICLGPTRAAVTGDDAKHGLAHTQIIFGAPGAMEWEVCVAEDMTFLAYINASVPAGSVRCTLSAGGAVRSAVLGKTEGVFPPQMLCGYFERLPLGGIRMSKGVHTVRLSIDELAPGDTVAVEGIWLKPIASAWPADADYGVMIHWTAQSMPREGEQLSYADAVDNFDVPRIVDELEQMGAKYLLLTANHEYPHFPGPLAAWEEEFPGQTTRRDLVRELTDALHARGMGFVLYVNPFAAYIRSPRVDRLLGADFRSRYSDNDVMPLECMPDYEEFSTKLVRAIGERYGKAIDGFWFDSCYQPFHHWPAYDMDAMAAAAKAGNPDRAVCLNTWALPSLCDMQDYWAGEVCDPYVVPPTGAAERMPVQGVLYHTLLVIDDVSWVHVGPGPVCAPRFTAEELAAHIRRCRAIGAPVTVNMGMYQDGGFGEESMAVMRKTKALLAE